MSDSDALTASETTNHVHPGVFIGGFATAVRTGAKGESETKVKRVAAKF